MEHPSTLISSRSKTSPKQLLVALAGNPNCGKTSLFNALTKLKQKVGNYPGVTVEKKIGRMMGSTPDRSVDILDLPGTYSLAVRSPDEQVARDVLLGQMPDTPRPDVVVCVVDAGNLERNLYLVSQIKDLGLPIIVVLNMMDAVKREGKVIDLVRLSQRLDAPIVPTVAMKEIGIEELKKEILQGTRRVSTQRLQLPENLQHPIERLVQVLKEEHGLNPSLAYSEALIILSKEDLKNEPLVIHSPAVKEVIMDIRQSLDQQEINWRSAAIEARYAGIQNILKDVVQQNSPRRISWSERIDRILMDKFFGWVFFWGIMGMMFFMIFSVATIPMNWIDGSFARLSDGLKTFLPPSELRDLLTDGVIAGVGGVVIFLPQILILFFFIGLLQDTGYMARAAFIMDRVMSKAGLHGKSFIPLLSSFACAIPGIMATRAIENPKDRLVTILVAPWMSCSARLPVYTILIATILPAASAWQKAGIMLFLYLLGILGAFAAAVILKRTILKGSTPFFIMEMPPYRWPSLRSVILQMWERSCLFLKKAGTIIFSLSILLWVLMSYPKSPSADISAQLNHSFAGRAGHLLEPLIKPLGFDWRIGIGLIGSFAAREVFVSTMNIVFNIGNADNHTEPLRAAFAQATWPDGSPLFTPLTCMSLLVFYIYAMQCLSTVAVVRRETNGWKWPVFQLVYMTGFAYLASLSVYQFGKLLNF